MTLFDDIMADANPALFEQFAEAVTYTPRGGAPVALSGIVEYLPVEDRPPAAGADRAKLRRARLTVLDDPASNYGGIASPQTNATCSAGGLEWAIESVEPGGGGTHLLTLTRPGASEISRPDYRTR